MPFTKDSAKDEQAEGQTEQQPKSVRELIEKTLGGKKKLEEKMGAEAEKLAETIKLIGSKYTVRGRCKECGWQTFQFDEGQAKDLVKTHAYSHWPEIIEREMASK